MGDLLIRNLPDYLREELANAASASGQNLSDAAKEAIRIGLSQSAKLKALSRPNAFEAIRAAIGAENLLSEDEFTAFHSVLDESRRQPDRPSVDFE